MVVIRQSRRRWEDAYEWSYEVAKHITHKVYGYVTVETDAIDLILEKTGALDVTILQADD